MDPKHLFALIVLVGCGSLGLLLTLLSQRGRDVALFVLVFAAPAMEMMNVTFFGQFWYRGTSRGIELSALDIVPVCLLCASLLLPRVPHHRFYWPASIGLMAVYLAYCAVGVAIAPMRLHGVWELAKMVRGLMVFLAAALFIRTRRELGIVVFALCAAVLTQMVVALQQRFGVGLFRASGTFDHENTLSTYLCMVAPVLVAAAMSQWPVWLRWFAGLSWTCAAGTELLTLSRMGIPVFAIVSLATAAACTSWRFARLRPNIVIVAAATLAVFFASSWDGIKARYTQGDLKAELTGVEGSETRGAYWRLAVAMVNDHPFGVGLNNWSYAVGKHYVRRSNHPYHDYDSVQELPAGDSAFLFAPAADSLPALTLGELGVVGFLLLLGVWLRWMQLGAVFLSDRLNDDPLHRTAIGLFFGALGIFLQSATEWTYRQPPIMYTFHILMAAAASLYWRRRAAGALATAAAVVPEADVDSLRVARATK